MSMRNVKVKVELKKKDAHERVRVMLPRNE
jgi:hypothetical protein